MSTLVFCHVLASPLRSAFLGVLSLFLLTWPTSGLLAGVGPVISTNFPDPGLAQAQNGVWYAFSTQNEKINIQLASSSDFTNWQLHKGYDALPRLPLWALQPPHAQVWAPDVNRRPDGLWVMYFAALHQNHPRKHCVGTATSPNITGPYTPSQETLVCNLPKGGNIDPNLFSDPVNGKKYLVSKTDGNSIGRGGECGNSKNPIAATPLHLQQLDSTDLTSLVGNPIFLISNLNGLAEDGPNVERPCMVYRNSTYYLLYNAQCYASLHYRIDYISCVTGKDTDITRGVAGCDWAALKKAQEGQKDRTLLKTGDKVSGTTLNAPGSMDVSDDQRKIVFHGDVNLEWFKTTGVKRDRAMFAGEIGFDKDSGDLKVTKLY